jgi:L-amino acid N-acyltransferase YncA
MFPAPIVSPASSADMAVVAGIFAHYVTDSVATFEEVVPTVADWQARLADLSAKGWPFLVARIGGELVGYAYASPWRPKPAYRYTVEDSVYLAPGWTGRGVGRALLERLLHACQQAGARQVVAVIADTGSDASAALHRRLGFTDAGRLAEVGRKHGRWIDTVLLQRALSTDDGR